MSAREVDRNADIARCHKRVPDRCDDCGRFVGFYPVGFYDDRYCASCYDRREDRRLTRDALDQRNP